MTAQDEPEPPSDRGESDSASAHVLTEPLVVVVAAGWVVVSGSRFVLPVLLPWITVDFGIDGTTAGILFTGLWTAYALTQFPTGLLADRTSNRTVLLLGIGVALVGTGVTSVAPTFETFVFGGLLFGVGAGLYAPPRVTVLSDAYDERRGSARGVTFAAGTPGRPSSPPPPEPSPPRSGGGLASQSRFRSSPPSSSGRGSSSRTRRRPPPPRRVRAKTARSRKRNAHSTPASRPVRGDSAANSAVPPSSARRWRSR